MIDLLCDQHLGLILETELWPRDWMRGAVCAAGCEEGAVPLLPQLDPGWQLAVHEASHAVCLVVTGTEIELVTLGREDLPGPGAGGVRFTSPDGSYDAAALMAGAAAVDILIQMVQKSPLADADVVDVVFGARHDFVTAYDAGLSDDDIAASSDMAWDLVTERWADITRVAEPLLARGRLTGREVSAAMTRSQR